MHSLHEPKSYSKAIKYPEWQYVMDKELRAFHHTYSWDLVPLPSNAKPVSCKWIYKIKTQSDEFVEQYKVRLVACGFHNNVTLTMKRHLLQLQK